jgi:peptidoglycan/LPS O-acetylase OafA/YrhL
MSAQQTAPRPQATGGAKDAQQKKSERGFRPDIQGMRAIAVAMVVLYHLYPNVLPGGFAGVDVFFVISGFLITGHLLREYQKNGRISLLGFWGRRAKRLVPAAALVLTVTWIAARFILPSTQLDNTARQIRASALYFQNWQLAANAVDYLKADSAATPVQHFWSLSVEEQFYLGWPLLFVLAALVALTARRRARVGAGPRADVDRRIARGHHTLIVLASAVVVASFGYSVYETHANPAAAYFVTTTRIWELGLGGLIALLPARLGARLSRFGLLGCAGLALVIASAFVLSGSMAFPGWLALLPAGGAALLIIGGSAAGRYGPAALTSVRPMVFLGGISYSLYLWHWPLIVLYTTWRGHPAGALSGAAIIVVSVLLSWGSKVWVEDKVRGARLLSGTGLKSGWLSVSTALAAVVPVVLVSLFIAGEPVPFSGQLGPDYPGAAALARHLTSIKPEPVLPAVTAITLPLYWRDGCLPAYPTYGAAPKECVYGDTRNPALTVALVGDSFDGDWFTPLLAIADQEHWELITDLRGSCPWTATPLVGPGAPSCLAWGKTVLHDLLATIKPDVVITSDDPDQPTAAHPHVGKQAMADIGAGMVPYWTQLENHGIKVVAMRETPNMGIVVPDCLAENPGSPANCAMPAKKVIPPDPPTVIAARAMGGKVPVINMNNLICAKKKCAAVVGNVLVYQDSHHLTDTYSGTLAPYLYKRLIKADKVFDRT